jgi:hypothetical protein
MRAFRPRAEPSAHPDHVLAWRVERLRAAGCSARLADADAVAHDRGYNLHELLELIDGGCPAELAVRTLAPLED